MYSIVAKVMDKGSIVAYILINDYTGEKRVIDRTRVIKMCIQDGIENARAIKTSKGYEIIGVGCKIGNMSTITANQLNNKNVKNHSENSKKALNTYSRAQEMNDVSEILDISADIEKDKKNMELNRAGVLHGMTKASAGDFIMIHKKLADRPYKLGKVYKVLEKNNNVAGVNIDIANEYTDMTHKASRQPSAQVMAYVSEPEYVRCEFKDGTWQTIGPTPYNIIHNEEFIKKLAAKLNYTFTEKDIDFIGLHVTDFHTSVDFSNEVTVEDKDDNISDSLNISFVYAVELNLKEDEILSEHTITITPSVKASGLYNLNHTFIFYMGSRDVKYGNFKINRINRLYYAGSNKQPVRYSNQAKVFTLCDQELNLKATLLKVLSTIDKLGDIFSLDYDDDLADINSMIEIQNMVDNKHELIIEQMKTGKSIEEILIHLTGNLYVNMVALQMAQDQLLEIEERRKELNSQHNNGIGQQYKGGF